MKKQLPRRLQVLERSESIEATKCPDMTYEALLRSRLALGGNDSDGAVVCHHGEHWYVWRGTELAKFCGPQSEQRARQYAWERYSYCEGDYRAFCFTPDDDAS